MIAQHFHHICVPRRAVLLTRHKKFSDNAIAIADVSGEDSELDSGDLVDLIKVQLQPLLALAQADPAVRPNDSFGHVFHPNILQIHPRSFTFGGHFEVGEVVVAPVDPIEDGQPSHSLGRPKNELSPGWDDAAPGPADEDIALLKFTPIAMHCGWV